MSPKATILGGGVVGLAVAAELIGRGVQVSLTDPKGAPGPHACSWWAGGMLAPDCEGFSAEEPVVRLGREAADWWEGQGAEVTRKGSIVVALGRDKRELDLFARRTASHRPLTRQTLAALEPDLDQRFDRALHMTDEAHLDPRKTLLGLRARLEPLLAPEPASPVIDCRGLAAQDKLPALRGVKGEMVVLHAPEIRISRPVRLLHPRVPLYIVPRGDGHYMLGATQIESEDRGRATVRSVLELLSAAYALHPGFGEAAIVEIGVDARPAFPDNLPRIGPLGDGLYVNRLFRHGFLLAPALARMVAAYLIDGQKPEVWHEDQC